MLLTIEYSDLNARNISEGNIEIFCDEEGIDFLIKKLTNLKKYGGHEHFKTPSWAGHELTEEKQVENNYIINHLTIYLTPP